MSRFLRWLGRALFALLIVLLLASIWTCWQFEQWKKARLATLDAGSTIVETAAGPIEYADFGSGPVVLISHGAPGGYDQAALLGRELAARGFRVIAPSRPGFLRTPLETGILFEDQADALAALLDELAIPRVSVLCFATGAQVATHFALRHPDRTEALVLVSPVTAAYRRDPYRNPRQLLAEAALFKTTGDMGSWLFVRKAADDPRWMLDRVLPIDTSLDDIGRRKLADFILDDPAQLSFFRDLVGTQAPLEPRESGTRNDLTLVRALDPVAYGDLQPPTLLVRGSADAARQWNDLKLITNPLPSASVLTVEGSGQIVWLGPAAAAMQEDIVRFLKDPPARRPPPTPEPR